MSENQETDKKLFCSFCGKNQSEVKKLIAGPSVYICDECVSLCNDIIKEDLAEACLLYTSPSPRDPKTSRMPSSA